MMHNQGISPEKYRKYALPESGNDYFDAKDFHPEQWAALAREAGMKWMCLTTRHHDGFSLRPADVAPIACVTKHLGRPASADEIKHQLVESVGFGFGDEAHHFARAHVHPHADFVYKARLLLET